MQQNIIFNCPTFIKIFESPIATIEFGHNNLISPHYVYNVHVGQYDPSFGLCIALCKTTKDQNTML